MNYPQVYFEECKYKIKKIKMSKFIKTDLNKQKKLFCWLWTNKKNSHFADFKQIICQKLFSEKLGDLRDATPCHAIGHFVFWCHYLTYRMPCHASGHLVIYREWYRFERAFFTLHSILLFSRLPRGQQFNLKVSRASCWSSKQSTIIPAIHNKNILVHSI